MRDIGDPPATADEIVKALTRLPSVALTERAMTIGEWLSPSMPYQGKGATMLDALQDLWRHLRKPLTADGWLVWRVRPEVEEHREFLAKRSTWVAYCRVGVVIPAATTGEPIPEGGA